MFPSCSVFRFEGNGGIVEWSVIHCLNLGGHIVRIPASEMQTVASLLNQFGNAADLSAQYRRAQALGFDDRKRVVFIAFRRNYAKAGLTDNSFYFVPLLESCEFDIWPREFLHLGIQRTLADDDQFVGQPVGGGDQSLYSLFMRYAADIAVIIFFR